MNAQGRRDCPGRASPQHLETAAKDSYRESRMDSRSLKFLSTKREDCPIMPWKDYVGQRLLNSDSNEDRGVASPALFLIGDITRNGHVEIQMSERQY